MPVSEPEDADLELLVMLAKQAGEIAMRWFGQDPEVWMKQGDSPVSEADLAVDRFLKQNLLAARPAYGWLSEETDDNLDRMHSRKIFVVDPIDGTRGFLKGSPQWCVSLAIVENGRPTSAVLECPALGQSIYARAGSGAMCNGASILASPVRGREEGSSLKISGPRSLQSQIEGNWRYQIDKMPFVPSLAYRIAMIAMGDADLSLARANARDWDIAAADLIAHEAGACLTDLSGVRPAYNTVDARHGPLIACRMNEHEEMLALARIAVDKTSLN